MRKQTKDRILAILRPNSKQTITEWATSSINYGRVPAYDSQWKSSYSLEMFPFYASIQDEFHNPDTKEIIVAKCARAGASENLLLTPLRYSVARAPKPILFITSGQQMTEKFMETRIKKGFGLSRETQSKFRLVSKETNAKERTGKTREHEIYFPDMELIVSWAGSNSITKGSGFQWVLADEISLYNDCTIDMLRRRTAAYPYDSKVVAISSPDPKQKRTSKDDPIFIEHDLGDKCRWTMPDPATGNPFHFSFPGIKWDESAKGEHGWDLERVQATAYYLTPDGTRIDEQQRLPIITKGNWTPSQKAKLPGRKSYHLPAMLVPFESCSFGAIAVAFLKAKEQGKYALKTFIYEYLAEPFYEEKEEVESEATIVAHCQPYKKGQLFTNVPAMVEKYKNYPKAAIISCDVQKDHIYYLVRLWCYTPSGYDSGLVTWGQCIDFEELEKLLQPIMQDSNKQGVKHIYGCTDVNYENRKLEALKGCYKLKMNGIIGSDKTHQSIRAKDIDPFEGSVNAKKKVIKCYILKKDDWMTYLLDLINNKTQYNWYLYEGIEHMYQRQLISTSKVDGEWISRGKAGDHLFDCETYNLALAYAKGFFQPKTFKINVEDEGMMSPQSE